MLGYGPEDKSTVMELTYNYGVTEYEKGNAYAQVWEIICIIVFSMTKVSFEHYLFLSLGIFLCANIVFHWNDCRLPLELMMYTKQLRLWEQQEEK